MLHLMGLAFAKPAAPVAALSPSADSGKTLVQSTQGIKQVEARAKPAVRVPPASVQASPSGPAMTAKTASEMIISARGQPVKAAVKTTKPASKGKPLPGKPVPASQAKGVQKANGVQKAAVKPKKAAAPLPVKSAKSAAKPAPAAAKKPNTAPVKKTSAAPVKKAVKPVVLASVKAAVPAKALSQASAAAAPKVAKKPAPASATRSAAPLAAAAVQPPSNLPPKLKTGTPLVNASSSAATVKPAAPQAAAPTKARSARAASITVPSMAQTVASTAAKSSYTQLPAPMVLVPILQASPVKDPKLVNNWKTKTADQLSDEEVLAMPDAQYMSDLQMAFFRLKLQQLKQEILNSAGETTEHLREETVIVPDPADRATIEEEHALELRTRDRERKLLKKIEQSITRIDAGDYGYCDETGEAIGVGRLMARPTATLSLEAQQRRELRQKMFGD